SESEARGWSNVDLVIDEWILLEYACTFLPAQQEAVVEAVSKCQVKLPEEIAKLMGLAPEVLQAPVTAAANNQSPLTLTRFTPLEEIEKALERRLDNLDIAALAEKSARDRIDRLKGRV